MWRAQRNKRLRRTGISVPVIDNLPHTAVDARQLKRDVGRLRLREAVASQLDYQASVEVISLAEEVQRMGKRVYLLNLVLALLVSATVLGQTAHPTNPPDEEKPIAPPFSLTSLKGEKFELAALRGKVVVLNFWFTGCVPCVAEFSKLNGLVNRFKNKEVVFIAPTLDDVTTLKLFLKEHRFKYHVVPNAGSLIVSTYSDGSGNVVFPTHIVINKEGKIDTRVTGADRIGDLLKAIARLADFKIEKAK